LRPFGHLQQPVELVHPGLAILLELLRPLGLLGLLLRHQPADLVRGQTAATGAQRLLQAGEIQREGARRTPHHLGALGQLLGGGREGLQ